MIRIALTGAIGSGNHLYQIYLDLFLMPINQLLIFIKKIKIYLKLKNKLPKYFRKFPISKRIN